MSATRGLAYVAGEPIPSVLVRADLAALLHLGTTQAWKLEKAGAFKFLELTPAIGRRARYSGKLVQQWIEGQTETSRFFGRKRGA
jgi:hypothetical protein